MCGFFVTNKLDVDVAQVTRFVRLRGPDKTQSLIHDGILFVHHLLSITGDFQPQPFRDESVTALFNGEIYNHGIFGTFSSDGYCIIPAYRNLGSLFSQSFDGEFAVVLVDHEKKCIILSTDLFATKPLHVAIDGPYFAISSYASALTAAGFRQIVRIPANRICRIDLAEPALREIGCVYEFSLHQYRRDFDGWVAAFEAAVAKRSVNSRHKLFIGLSSGYDSGGISLALTRLGLPFHAYTVLGKEDDAVLAERHSRMPGNAIHRFITPTEEVRSRARLRIDLDVEEKYYTIYSALGDYNEFHLRLHEDSGATGLSMVCEMARQDNCLIYLSGQGADEILSDYGFGGQRIYAHSNFGGQFPEDLHTIFPWPSFYGSSQESYLMKEEYVAGAYGIEARYPFLDKRVVQEFLALDHRLKNFKYKSALAVYLEAYGYPTAYDRKIGF